MKKRSILTRALSAAVLAALGLAISGCGQKSAKDDNTLYVYNWGEYIGENVVKEFEKRDRYQRLSNDTFETNEEMLPIIEAGAVQYDVVCPSDYIIQKMIEKDLIQPIDFDKVPNYKNIDPKYLEKSKGFDPENKYSVPYWLGVLVGIPLQHLHGAGIRGAEELERPLEYEVPEQHPHAGFRPRRFHGRREAPGLRHQHDRQNRARGSEG